MKRLRLRGGKPAVLSCRACGRHGLHSTHAGPDGARPEGTAARRSTFPTLLQRDQACDGRSGPIWTAAGAHYGSKFIFGNITALGGISLDSGCISLLNGRQDFLKLRAFSWSW
jgi:hypothetical protein